MDFLAKTSPLFIYGQLALALVFNLGGIYFIKKSEGFTVFWPSVMVIAMVGMTQFFISRMVATGTDLSIAIMLIVVSVMVGSVIMGFFLFGESMPAQKVAGMSLAVAGVIIASLAKA